MNQPAKVREMAREVIPVRPESADSLVVDAPVVEPERDASTVYVEPSPNRFVLWASHQLMWNLGFPGIPLIRHIKWFVRLFPWFLGMRVKGVEFPAEDVARAKRAINKDTAGYLAPNHTEFFTDFVMGHDVTRHISKRFAYWVGFDLVNGFLSFIWRRHNLIANSPGGEGRAYSLKSALRGDGVFIHPEGNVWWCASHLQRLFPGIGKLPVECVHASRAGDGRDVYVVPTAYRWRFIANAHEELGREISFIERRLRLPETTGTLGDRFFALNLHILKQRSEMYGVALGALRPANFFAAQTQYKNELIERLERAYGLRDVPLAQDTINDDFAERIFRLEKALRKRKRLLDDKGTQFTADTAVLNEVSRAHVFSQKNYGAARLTQEDIAESLKRIRQHLIRGRLFDGLRAFMPFAVADRVAHVRTAEPIVVGPIVDAHGEDAPLALMREYRSRQQARMDALRAEFAEADASRTVDNLLVSAQPAQAPAPTALRGAA